MFDYTAFQGLWFLSEVVVVPAQVIATQRLSSADMQIR